MMSENRRSTGTAVANSNQNPNCKSCFKPIRLDNNDTVVSCSLCNGAHHLPCSGITKTTLNEMSKKETQVAWFCTTCNGPARSLLKGMADLEEKSKKFELRIAALEGQIKLSPGLALAGPIPNGRPSTLPAAENADDFCVTMMDEIHDQKRREKNLMIFGLPEEASEETDQEAVVELLQKVGADQGFVSFRRLGNLRDDGSGRPIKIGMSTVDIKVAALSKAKVLKDKTGYDKVYIKPDLTKMQLRRQRKLVGDLRIANINERRMKIYNGRLVPLEKKGEKNVPLEKKPVLEGPGGKSPGALEPGLADFSAKPVDPVV